MAAVHHGGVQVARHLRQLLSGPELAAFFGRWTAPSEFQTPDTQRAEEMVLRADRYR